MAEPHLTVAATSTPRRFQFGLRTLFVVVTVVAVLLGAVMVGVIVPGERQRRAVAAIREAGSKVVYAPPDELGWHDALKAWLPTDYFETVVEVSVDTGDDELLRQIGTFTELRIATIRIGRFTDAGLVHLAGLQQLEELWLPSSEVTDAGLAHLAGLKQLRKLHLLDSQVTDAGLAHLAGLKQLQELGLYGSPVTDAGLAHLAGLKQLRGLTLVGTQVTEAGVNELRKALPDCGIVHSEGRR